MKLTPKRPLPQHPHTPACAPARKRFQERFAPIYAFQYFADHGGTAPEVFDLLLAPMLDNETSHEVAQVWAARFATTLADLAAFNEAATTDTIVRSCTVECQVHERILDMLYAWLANELNRRYRALQAQQPTAIPEP